MHATTNIVTILLVYCSWGLPTDNRLEFNSGLKLKCMFWSACIKLVIKSWIKSCNFIWWYLQIWHKQILSLMLWSNILDYGNSAFLWRTFFLIVFLSNWKERLDISLPCQSHSYYLTIPTTWGCSWLLLCQ